ncbi:MAG: hypothetical protein ACX93T_00225 [Bacteroidota bacterium]
MEAFTKYTAQYQFEEVEQQLALLKLLGKYLPDADLGTRLEQPQAPLRQTRKRKSQNKAI